MSKGPTFDCLVEVRLTLCVSVHLSGLNAMGVCTEHVVVMVLLITHAQLRICACVCGGQERASMTWSPRESERALAWSHMHETESARVWEQTA